jgi:hypothetical protein
MGDSEKKPRKGAGRVAFLAHLEGIKKMIEAGHPLVSVFEAYENKLSIKSGQFGKYVRKYIKGEVKNEGKPEAKDTGATRKPRGVESGHPKFKPSGRRDDLV